MCSLGLLCENCVSRTHKKSRTLTNPKPKPQIQDMAFPGPQETCVYILASLSISNGREKGHDLQQSSIWNIKQRVESNSPLLACGQVFKVWGQKVKRWRHHAPYEFCISPYFSCSMFPIVHNLFSPCPRITNPVPACHSTMCAPISLPASSVACLSSIYV